MATYSTWDPVTGKWEYWEGKRDFPLGDDLPTRRYVPINDLGVPSSQVGQPLPSGARRVGTGDVPRGVVAPFSGVSAFGALRLWAVPSWAWFGMGAALGVGVGYYWWRRS